MRIFFSPFPFALAACLCLLDFVLPLCWFWEEDEAPLSFPSSSSFVSRPDSFIFREAIKQNESRTEQICILLTALNIKMGIDCIYFQDLRTRKGVNLMQTFHACTEAVWARGEELKLEYREYVQGAILSESAGIWVRALQNLNMKSINPGLKLKDHTLE